MLRAIESAGAAAAAAAAPSAAPAKGVWTEADDEKLREALRIQDHPQVLNAVP